MGTVMNPHNSLLKLTLANCADKDFRKAFFKYIYWLIIKVWEIISKFSRFLFVKTSCCMVKVIKAINQGHLEDRMGMKLYNKSKV